MQDVQSALCLLIMAAMPGLLPAGRRSRTQETPPMISGADLCFPSHKIPAPGFIYAGVNTHRHGCPPFIKHIKYSIRVETLLTLMSHLILNQPPMEGDTCGFFMASEVSLNSAETDAPALSALSATFFIILSLFTLFSVFMTQKNEG